MFGAKANATASVSSKTRIYFLHRLVTKARQFFASRRLSSSFAFCTEMCFFGNNFWKSERNVFLPHWDIFACQNNETFDGTNCKKEDIKIVISWNQCRRRSHCRGHLQMSSLIPPYQRMSSSHVQIYHLDSVKKHRNKLHL